MVEIYSLNITTNLYITTPEITPSTGGDIYSVWVNTNGDKIYVATWVGCKLINYNGSNWIVNPPSFISSVLSTYPCSYIKKMDNQSKIIIYEWGTKSLIVLKSNGTHNLLHQNFTMNTLNSNCLVPIN